MAQQANANLKPFRTRKKKKKKLKLLELPHELVLSSLARTYLMRRYFDAARLLRKFSTPHRLLYKPLPVCPEVLKLESKLHPYKVKNITSKNLKFIPAVELQSGGFYEGQWDIKSESLEGSGVRIYPDNSKFIGYFHDWMRNLQGRYIKVGGDIYEGEYDGDRMQGKGLLIRSEGTLYWGDFEKDLESGKGILKLLNHGKGLLNDVESAKEVVVEEGKEPEENNQGLNLGKGVILAEDLKETLVYEGDFMGGMKHGKGKFFMPDGNVYEGVFKNNTMDGYGKFTWTDGVVYIGQWKFNKFDGEGLQTWPDGRRYKGYYVKGLREGYGEFIWPDGREYKGEWKKDHMDGEGFYTFAACSIKENTSLNNKGNAVQSKPKTLKCKWEKGRRVKWL
jgi:hypothetical protein